MPSKKSLDRRRQVAGKILHIRNVQGVKRADIPANDDREYVPMELYMELLGDGKKLAGSILSSKDDRGFLARLVGGK
jgi:hypothetical protein